MQKGVVLSGNRMRGKCSPPCSSRDPWQVLRLVALLVDSLRYGANPPSARPSSFRNGEFKKPLPPKRSRMSERSANRE